MRRAVLPLAAVSLAWGVFTFGGVYPWAYWPLAVLLALVGIAGVLTTPRGSGLSRPLIASLLAIAAVMVVQLVPVPESTLAAVSPSAPAAIRNLDPMFAIGATLAHPLSIEPRATLLALALYLALIVFLGGVARALAAEGPSTFGAYLVVLGASVAFVAIVLPPSPEGRLYGFWQPEGVGTSYGPFVNRNHYAGWMLMACPVAFGLLVGRLMRAVRGVRPTFRDRLLWAASRHASLIVLLALCTGLMMLSLLLTRSRSGMAGLAVAVAVSCWFVLRSGMTRRGKAAFASLIVIALAGVGLWAGMGEIAGRFADIDWSRLGHRRGAWADAWRVIQMFPLTGTGVNTYGTAMLLYQQYATIYHFSTPHNAVLQILAEGGVLLAVPVAASVWFAARDIRARFAEPQPASSYWIRAGAVTAIVAIVLQEMIEFSLQMPGNAALFTVACAIALHHSPPGRLAGPAAPPSAARS